MQSLVAPLFSYQYSHEFEKPYCIYRISNKKTGKFYIGSTGALPARIRTHRNLIRERRHPNGALAHDSLWCDEGDWGFRILSRHASKESMIARETLLIRVFAGRKIFYNIGLNYTNEEVPVEWILFDLGTGRFFCYLNKRSAHQDFSIPATRFEINTIGLLQFNSFLLFKPKQKWAGNFRGSNIPRRMQERISLLLERDSNVKYIVGASSANWLAHLPLLQLQKLVASNTLKVSDLLKPSGRRGANSVKRQLLEKLIKTGDIKIEGEDIDSYATLTEKGKKLAAISLRQTLENLDESTMHDICSAEQLALHEIADFTLSTALLKNSPLSENLLGNRHKSPLDNILLVTKNGHTFNGNIMRAEPMRHLSAFNISADENLRNTSNLLYLTRKGKIAHYVPPTPIEIQKKKTPWKISLADGDELVSALKTTTNGNALVCAASNDGAIIIVPCCNIPSLSMGSNSFVLTTLTKNSILVGACVSFPNHKLAVITSRGAFISITATSNLISSRGAKPLKIKGFKESFGEVIWIGAQDRLSYSEAWLEAKLNTGRIFHFSMPQGGHSEFNEGILLPTEETKEPEKIVSIDHMILNFSHGKEFPGEEFT
jgi:hypothetical protein